MDYGVPAGRVIYDNNNQVVNEVAGGAVIDAIAEDAFNDIAEVVDVAVGCDFAEVGNANAVANANINDDVVVPPQQKLSINVVANAELILLLINLFKSLAWLKVFKYTPPFSFQVSKFQVSSFKFQVFNRNFKF